MLMLRTDLYATFNYDNAITADSTVTVYAGDSIGYFSSEVINSTNTIEISVENCNITGISGSSQFLNIIDDVNITGIESNAIGNSCNIENLYFPENIYSLSNNSFNNSSVKNAVFYRLNEFEVAADAFGICNGNFKVYTNYEDSELAEECVSAGVDCITDASNGKLDRIFVKSVSRFARNSLECLEAIRILKSLDVTVIFENDNIDTETMNSELILYVKSAFAQSEALSGSKRVSTAIRMKMENGEFITYNAPYGYKLDKECHLLIVLEEAKVIRRIFELYLSGKGMGKIAETLNDENIPNASGKWSVSGIRYILLNEKYIGDSILQKTYTPCTLPLKNIPNRGELDMHYVSNSHKGIISRETFELTKRRMSQTTCERKTPQKHLFTGIIECESCGWAYKRKVQNGVVYWVCSRKKSAGHFCESKNISEENLKKAFVKMYNKLRRFESEILDRIYNQLLKLREKLSGQNNEVSPS